MIIREDNTHELISGPVSGMAILQKLFHGIVGQGIIDIVQCEYECMAFSSFIASSSSLIWLSSEGKAVLAAFSDDALLRRFHRVGAIFPGRGLALLE